MPILIVNVKESLSIKESKMLRSLYFGRCVLDKNYIAGIVRYISYIEAIKSVLTLF